MNLAKRIGIRLTYNTRNVFALLEHLLQTRSLGQNSQCIYIDISNPNLERYFYLLLKFFDVAGYGLHIKANANLLLNLRNYSDFIYDIPGLRIGTRPPKSPLLWLTDRLPLPARKGAVFVDTDYFRPEKEPSSMIWPYAMHPEVYHLRLHNSLGSWRTISKKNIRIFLGGNLSDAYLMHSAVISDLFRKVNRAQVANYLQTSITRDRLVIASTPQQTHEVLRENCAARMLMIKGAFFKVQEWMALLARSDFFVALPGVCMPFSHNVIEAMAVGAIPILQYPEMFHPPLEHLKNCITYKDEFDLCHIIDRCLSYDYNTVLKLRANAIDYYDCYLSPGAVVARLIDKVTEINRLYVNAEHVSVAHLLRARGCPHNLKTSLI